jgi:HAD superfamily hydrolase (TIGR01484 family)
LIQARLRLFKREDGETGSGKCVDHNYRMIAIDLDGTLLSPTGHVTPRVRQAVHRALEAGLSICFATGRNWTESRAIIEAVGHYDQAVFVGGAMVIDTRNGVTLHRTMMHPALAREVCGVLESSGHAVCALQDTGTAGVDYLVTGLAELNDATRQWMSVTAAVVHRVPRLAGHAHEHTVRVGIVAAPQAVATARQGLLERFGETIVCHSLFVPAYDVEVMEVFDPAVNKWQGVLNVARHHGIEPEHIVAVGDDVNDIPMLANAALGVAMGNARPEVRAVAGRVIRSNAEEGLAEFLEELAEARVRPTDVPEGTGR